MSAIKGLSHVGVWVKDLEKMAAFYTGVVGLKVSHGNDRAVFMSSDPEREDHEVVLFQGRDGDAKVLQQLSFRVHSVEDVRDYYQSFKSKCVPIQQTVSHGAGVSCYFYDPEGNRLEVFADVPVESTRGYRGPIDLECTADELIAQVQSVVTRA